MPPGGVGCPRLTDCMSPRQPPRIGRSSETETAARAGSSITRLLTKSMVELIHNGSRSSLRFENAIRRKIAGPKKAMLRNQTCTAQSTLPEIRRAKTLSATIDPSPHSTLRFTTQSRWAMAVDQSYDGDQVDHRVQDSPDVAHPMGPARRQSPCGDELHHNPGKEPDGKPVVLPVKPLVQV